MHGADFLAATELPAWVLLTAIILISALLNLFVGSASAKWALIAPVMVPMLMLLGIHLRWPPPLIAWEIARPISSHR